MINYGLFVLLTFCACLQKGPGDDLYIPGTAVVLSETLKLIGSLALITAQEKSLSGLLKVLVSFGLQAKFSSFL